MEDGLIIRSVTGQPCLDFNRTHLPRYHQAFANPYVEFDYDAQQYVPATQGEETDQGNANSDQHQRLELLPGESTSGASNPPRCPFWDEMFPSAMNQLKEARDEPAGLFGTRYSIRSAVGWPEVVTTLEVARAKYYKYAGFIGFWKKTGRRLADHATDGQTLLSLLPDSEYTSVIHCVFDVIFDAAKRTAEIRGEVEQTLRQMREKLSDVERVVALFAQDDENIVTAAMNVLVSLLQAIEDIVLYYSAKRGLKTAASAMWKKEEYRADLSACLAGIESSSKRLIGEANLSHIHVTQSIKIKASEGLEKLKELQLHHLTMAREQKRIAEKQSELATSGRKIASRQQKLAAGLSREAAANERNAKANTQNAATNLINATISATAFNGFLWLADECFKAKTDLERERLWNIKLMIALHESEERSRSRGRYSPPSPEPRAISLDQLLGILNMPSSGEEADMATISDSTVLVNRGDQGRAEQLINNLQFRQWIVEPRSTELLVHGHMKPSRTSISALSLFSATIAQSLRRDPRFCTLAFFCGEHTDTSDDLAGGRGLIKSLLVQLLTQYPFSNEDLGYATRNMDLDCLDPDTSRMCQLFKALVRRVRNTTLFCILDGVEAYDDPLFLEGLDVERVLYDILSLTTGTKAQTHVKVLMMSPTATTTIQEGFDERDVVSMVEHGQPRGEKRFDGGRLEEQLGGFFLW